MYSRVVDDCMSDDKSDIEAGITEEQVRVGFEAMYGVTIEEVIGVLKQNVAENHRLLETIEASSEELEEAGFTEAESDSMQDIQDHVNERNP
jgi:hypothetical protein